MSEERLQGGRGSIQAALIVKAKRSFPAKTSFVLGKTRNTFNEANNVLTLLWLMLNLYEGKEELRNLTLARSIRTLLRLRY